MKYQKGYKKKKIGEILVEQEIINQNQLEQALFRQHTTQNKLGQILFDLGYVSQEQLEEALSIQNNEELVND